MKESLAVKYRPKAFKDVVEQGSTKIILSQQLSSGEVKHSYLFVGSAGTGKTTCARIFANEINEGKGNPIEIDAASHGNVDDIRDLVIQAKLKPLEGKYKVFIIDECHCLSSAGWSAMLKLIEEPPLTAIFIFCTTDVQKVPKTIMSRCQRFDFQRISQEGIVKRLKFVCDCEVADYEESYQESYPYRIDIEALEFIAKQADGGMRDSLTYLDKCLAYSRDLTIDNVVKALGAVDYEIMMRLTDDVCSHSEAAVIEVIEDIHGSGRDLKLFLKNYIQFLLDAKKWSIGCDWKYIKIPQSNQYESWLKHIKDWSVIDMLFEKLIRLQNDIKYSSSPKYDIEACILLIIGEL